MFGEKTQNSNEFFNSTLWTCCPKTSGSSKGIASDSARIKEPEMKSSSTLDARRALRMRTMHEHFFIIEDVTYEAGAF
ncbi:hypothetical protein TNCV_2487941 [Trichonephila clavipes]|uniref:Uncharacterized protein n=1 Tax=Trichonephila clavipes TaxID=2585209 RepID=A0A8X6W053_TRICX|nr:hypothetical protein TNCV_2487941 [Trichonephila clavipes]